ncbi:MAG TPA: outer membrane protein assembly factor BamB [Ramlibacter sp.]|nr:outer membrane protein assembly factor BamB [Ramlibacter sp.]
MIRPLCIAACAVALAGCASYSLPTWLGGVEKPKPAALVDNPATLGVKQAWTAKIGAVDYPLNVQVQGTTITLASSDGQIVSLDATSGRELSRIGAGGALAAGVGSDGKTTAVVTRDNDLVTFEGGKEIWRQKLGIGVYTAPFVAGARVFVLLADRSVSAYDGKTGRRLWTQSRAAQQQPLVLKHAGAMLAVGDTLVVGQQGRLAGLNPLTGAPRWEAPVATPRGINDVERVVDLVGRVSRVAENVCVRAFQAAVGCVDTTRGNVIWSKPANGTEGVDGDSSYVFGTEANGTVNAYKRTDGDRLWTTDMLAHRGLTAPLVLGRAVVIGDSLGYVHLLNRDDGKLLNRVATDNSAIAAAPVVVGTTLVVVTKSGGVFAFAPQ